MGDVASKQLLSPAFDKARADGDRVPHPKAFFVEVHPGAVGAKAQGKLEPKRCRQGIAEFDLQAEQIVVEIRGLVVVDG